VGFKFVYFFNNDNSVYKGLRSINYNMTIQTGSLRPPTHTHTPLISLGNLGSIKSWHRSRTSRGQKEKGQNINV